MHPSISHRRGHYGFDAPYAPIGMLVGALISLGMAAGWAAGPVPLVYGPLWLGLYGVLLLGMTGSYVYTTRRGKFEVWAELVHGLDLRGDERALDLGCGRGLVLLELARHLEQHGEAVGVDLWRSVDQSGNDPEATLANACAEGVADRVTLRTGDITRLPFDDRNFDVVTCSLVIHNIRLEKDRIQALREAVRVLRPGGRLLIADFRQTGFYAEQLHAMGMTGIRRRNLGWRFWYGGPPWATWLVEARKPD